MPKAGEFLVEGIMPSREVHLLGGPSGCGKTTLSFQQLNEWQQGHDFLGHKSYPVPYVYISLDRSKASVTRTLERLNLQNNITRLVCQDDIPENCTTVTQVTDKALSIYPDSELLVMEGYQLMAGDRGNSYSPVAGLLRKSGKICTGKSVTIIGVCHSPKTKMDDGYSHPRETIMGSAAWGAYSDTVIAMNLDETSGIITVKVLPRNAASEQHEFIFGVNGMLEPAVRGSKKDTLRIRIAALPLGATLMTSDLHKMGADAGAEKSTVKRVIDECITNKVLARVEDGMYVRSSQSPLHVVDQNEFIVDL